MLIATKELERFIERYGCEVALAADGVRFAPPYRAFVQPLRYKNKMYLEGTRTRIGYADASYYLYVGPAAVDMTALPTGAVLKMGEQRFYLSHAESVRLADQTVYMWAVLRALVEEA